LGKGPLAQAAFFPSTHQFCHLAGFLYLCLNFLGTKIKRSYQKEKILVAVGLRFNNIAFIVCTFN
jgi:hypothetical protein